MCFVLRKKDRARVGYSRCGEGSRESVRSGETRMMWNISRLVVVVVIIIVIVMVMPMVIVRVGVVVVVVRVLDGRYKGIHWPPRILDVLVPEHRLERKMCVKKRY